MYIGILISLVDFKNIMSNVYTNNIYLYRMTLFRIFIAYLNNLRGFL